MTIAKAVSVFSATTIGACVLLCISIIKLYDVSLESNLAIAQEVTLLNLASELSVSSTELTRLARMYTVTGNPQAELDYLEIASERSGQTPRKSTRSIAAGENIALTTLIELNGASLEELEKLTLTNDLSNTLIALETEAMFAVKGMFKDNTGAYTIQKEPDQAYAIDLVFSDTYQNELTKIQKPLEEFFVMLTERTQKEAAMARTSVYRQILFLGFIIIIVLTLSSLFLVFSRVKICQPLAKTVAYVIQVKDGNFIEAPKSKSNNEISVLTRYISNMVKNLVMLINKAEEKTKEAARSMEEAEAATEKVQLAQAVEEVRRDNMLLVAKQLEEVVKVTTTVSLQLSSTIEQSAFGAEQQAIRVSTTATAVEEMASNVLEVARSAGSAVDISANTRKEAENGADVVRDCILAIVSVETSSNVLKSGMDTLTKNAQAISQIMGVISDIADQTNLLALNAAIEAARAGDAGRGFAVVADEVRKLAEKTMASTTDVGNAITSIQESANTSMRHVEDTMQNVTQATELIEQCGQALHEIVNLAEATASQVKGIAMASEQQSIASEEIAHSIVDISDIAVETNLAMKNASQVVVEFTSQTQLLNTLIAEMKHDGEAS